MKGAAHPVTLNGTGNTTGPTRYHVCVACNTRKAESQFRAYTDYNGREQTCTKCRNEQTAAWKERTGYHARKREERDQERRARPAPARPRTSPQRDARPIDGEAARAIWATIVRHTIEQMRTPRPRPRTDNEYSRAGLRAWARNRAEATCWLGSRQATPVFEMLGYDQDVHLPRIRWSEYARALLDGQAEWGPLAEDRVRLLEAGIRYLRRDAA